MSEPPAGSADRHERIVYESRFSPRIYLFGAFQFILILFTGYVAILIMGYVSKQRSFLIFVVLMSIPWIPIIIRDWRTSLYVTTHRIVRRSGIIFRSETVIELGDVDTALLQQQSQGDVGAIFGAGGKRIALTRVLHRAAMIRTILALTGNEPPPEVDDRFAIYRLVEGIFNMVGMCTFGLLCFLPIGPLLASEDLTMIAYAVILTFTLLPVGAGVGWFLGNVIAILIFSYRLALDDIIEIIEIATHTHSILWSFKQNGACSKLCYLVYEKVLSWRYGRKIVLPR